jgi:hypothetical protein
MKTTYEYFNFINNGLSQGKCPKAATSLDTTPQRFKRGLASNTSSPSRSPQKKRFAGGNEHEVTTGDVLSELNIDELVGNSSTQLKVVIVIPSGRIETVHSFHEATKSLVINLVRKNWKSASSVIFNHPLLCEELITRLRQVVSGEFKEYCADKSESILKHNDPVDLSTFSNKHIVHEAGVICPYWSACIRGACNVQDDSVSKGVNAMALSTSVAARCRNHKMSAVAYRISTILFHSGVRFNDIERLQKLGICMSPDSIVKLQKKMGENCDSRLQMWKKDVELNKRSCLLLSEVKEKQVPIAEEDDMQLIVDIDFSEYIISHYKNYNKTIYSYCQDILKNESCGMGITDDSLDKALWKLSTKIPSYK